MRQLTVMRSARSRKTAPTRPRPGFDADPTLHGVPRIRVDDIVVDGDTLLSVTMRIGDHECEGMRHLGDRAQFTSTTYARIAGIRDGLAAIQDEVIRHFKATQLLRGLGIQLFRDLFDDETRTFLWKHRHELGGLVLESSGELDLPWELVHLEPPADLADDHERHFLATYGLVRWVGGARHPLELHVRRGRVRALCPDYGGTLRLASLDEEASTLAQSFGAPPLRHMTHDDVSAAMRSRFDLLHFAGHGVWSATTPIAEELLLDAPANPVEGDEPGDRADSAVAVYTDADLRRDLRRTRPRAGVAPMVVLNACDLGRVPSGSAQPAGFARTFLQWGAGAFVGCSWPVGDQPAAEFAAAFYGGLVADHLTIREATIAARRQAAQHVDVSELAYSVYAHPDARILID